MLLAGYTEKFKGFRMGYKTKNILSLLESCEKKIVTKFELQLSVVYTALGIPIFLCVDIQFEMSAYMRMARLLVYFYI